MSGVPPDAESRKAARAHAEVRVFRQGERELEADRFEDAWPRKVQANFAEGLRCNVIGLEELLQNKRAAGRPQDLADVAGLERLHRLKK